MYINQWESNIGNNNQITQFGEYSQLQSFDESCTILTPLETIPTVPIWSNEADESPFLFCRQPSQEENYSVTNTIKHDQFMTSSLQLVAKSLMSSSDDSMSSSEKYGQLHSSSGKYDNKPFCDYFPQEHKKVMESDDASPSQKSLQISFQRNQWNSCTQQDKQYGVPFATSSNSDSRRTAPGKRRIRWTKDLHELFIVIVNHLGGPEKAKPKAILEMMGTDMLTIPNVKSHLQKYRSALHMHAALKDKQYGVPFATSSNSDSRRTAPGKRRIRWTKDLHELFIVIVNHLGGPEKAKPKAILEMMGTDMLTIPNVKSHLQKYRSALHMHAALKGRSNERHRKDDISELQLKIQMQIEESGQLQLEIQKSNHQQMEMQRNLQLLIEQQKKQLKLMLDQQKQRTNLEKNGASAPN